MSVPDSKRKHHGGGPWPFPLVALTAVALGLATLPARAVEHNFGAWHGLFTQGKFSEHWGWFFESQIRLHHGWEFGGTPDSLETRGNRLLIRPALRWLPRGDNSLQVHLGYGWTPNFSPERGESRLWQQVQMQQGQPTDEIQVTHRLRLEQRHIEFTRGLAQRARYMLRGMRLYGERHHYGVAAWDEVFWNLNTVAGGAKAGFDQNRLFLGPVVQVAPGARLEAGYLNVYCPTGTQRAPWMTHLWSTFLFLDLP